MQIGLGVNYQVISEGLNGRTTVIDDPYENPLFCGHGGQGMSGRRYLTPCLYSHRPLDLVILGLGCNDLKSRFALNPDDIANGVMTLVADVLHSAAGPDEKPPKVVVISPPLCRETDTNAEWGFIGCAAKSSATIEAIRKRCASSRVPFVDLTHTPVGTDGIHFNAASSANIASYMVTEVLQHLPR